MTTIFAEYEARKAKEAKLKKEQEVRSDYIDEMIGAVGIPCETLDVSPLSIDSMLQDLKKTYGLEINPDFQRGHVWTTEQKIRFVENLIRGAVGTSGRLISFNCPEYKIKPTDVEPDMNHMVCIDGLQRLTAISEFVNGQFKIFPQLDVENNGVNAEFFNGTRRALGRVGNGIKFQIFDMQRKKDVLDYYIALNSAGTAHTVEEIMRVIKLRLELD